VYDTTIFEFAKVANNFHFPLLPKRKEVGDEIVEQLKDIKTGVLKVIQSIDELRLDDAENVTAQKYAKLEKLLINLYFIYENQQNLIKKSKNLLDFYDLEKYMKILSEKENLFSGIKYVFVDEYQDTNKVQEKIIKNVAKNCNFVAVGDVKQGIYGFRLASSEIFLRDIENFEKHEDSQVNYLQSNFRSDKNVLNFINNVFKVCMTKESAGVDYEKTSMLNGVEDFKPDGKKSVNIDLIVQAEKTEKPLPEIYSVLNDNFDNNSKDTYLELIKLRINEVMSSQIYDKGQLRQCKYSDIAILARKRDDTFAKIANYLQENNVPIFSNSRSVLMEEPEIMVLLNYLKLALGYKDDVALLSVLTSALCEISIDEIVNLKKNSEKTLYELVFQEKNPKFETFLSNFCDFLRDCAIYGAKQALEKLFDKTNYLAYVCLKKNGSKAMNCVERFMTEIEQSGLAFDLGGLVNHFESVEISVGAEPTTMDDCVLLTTIHNSKGLEYPIVFLIGCDQSLKKTPPKVDVEINEDYGLAVKNYNIENNNETVGVRMRAIQNLAKRKNFTEELMIFYVALTRAKNRLYLFGRFEEKLLNKKMLKDCDSYFDLVFHALPKLSDVLQSCDKYEEENLCVSKIDGVYEITPRKETQQNLIKEDKKLLKQIKDYINFSYQFDNLKNFKLKESVTNLSQKDQENVLQKYSNDTISFSTNAIEIGNAYHLALKLIDFDKVDGVERLEELLQNNENLKNSAQLIDLQVLFKNISLLKELTQGAKVFKEKEFVMKDSVSNLVGEEGFEDEVLVQGVIDLFAIKDGKVVLVDYKYSNSNNDEYLLKKYKNQLKLYKIAIKNAFNLEISQIYLLSLKNSKLINVQI